MMQVALRNEVTAQTFNINRFNKNAMRKQLAASTAAPTQSAPPSTHLAEFSEEVTDEAFTAHVARLAEVFGPGYACQDQTKFVEDLVHFMHYGGPFMTHDQAHAENEGLRQFHESSLDGTDGCGVFHIEDVYEVAFKSMYQTRTIPFSPDIPPRPPVLGRAAKSQVGEPLATQPEDYEDDRDHFSVDLSKRAPLISHTQSREGIVETWAKDVLLTHPQVTAVAAKLPHYPTFLDALAAMREGGSQIVGVPAPPELVAASLNAPKAISDESLVCIAQKAGAICLDRGVYDSLRQCGKEFVDRMCEHLTARTPNSNNVATAQAVQEALQTSNQLTVLGYGYKGLVV
jgi:hypothetical protein